MRRFWNSDKRRFWSWDNPLVLLPAGYILLTNSPDNNVEVVIWWILLAGLAGGIVAAGVGVLRRYVRSDPVGKGPSQDKSREQQNPTDS